jgi:hypothetical protein
MLARRGTDSEELEQSLPQLSRGPLGSYSSVMEKSAFIAAFNLAASCCRDFAQQFVVEELPLSLRFDFAAANREVNQDGHVSFLPLNQCLRASISGLMTRFRNGSISWFMLQTWSTPTLM